MPASTNHIANGMLHWQGPFLMINCPYAYLPSAFYLLATTSAIDATSRIETYTNVLPRYYMLSLIYNIDWAQKSKHNRQ